MKKPAVSERPYEKAMEQGVEVLSDAELFSCDPEDRYERIVSARALAEEDIDAGRSSGTSRPSSSYAAGL